MNIESIATNQKLMKILGRALRIATSFAVLVPAVCASFIYLYLIIPLPKIENPNSTESLIENLAAVSIFVLLVGGMILLVKIIVGILGVNLSKDLEEIFTKLPQALNLSEETILKNEKERKYKTRLISVISFILTILTIYATVILKK